MTTQPHQQPADDGMDLDAWLDDLELATTTVTVYAKASLVDRHNDLNEQLRVAQQRQRQAAEEGSPEATLGDEGESAEVDRLVAEVDANYQEMKASGRTFIFTALTQEVYDDLLKAHTHATAEPDQRFDGEGFMLASMAAASVPRRSLEQIQTLRRRLPTSEFGRLAAAVNKVIHGSVDLPL